MKSAGMNSPPGALAAGSGAAESELCLGGASELEASCSGTGGVSLLSADELFASAELEVSAASDLAAAATLATCAASATRAPVLALKSTRVELFGSVDLASVSP